MSPPPTSVGLAPEAIAQVARPARPQHPQIADNFVRLRKSAVVGPIAAIVQQNDAKAPPARRSF
jgi:hypothetical protein